MGSKNSKGSKGEEKIQTKLCKKSIKLLVKKAGLSKNEAQDFFNSFMANNPDGKIDKTEFARLYQSLWKEPVADIDDVANLCFRGFKKTNNESLTFEEFTIGYGVTSKMLNKNLNE